MPIAAILAFLKSPLARYIGLALLIAGILVFVVHRFNAWEDSLRQQGRDEMAAHVAQVVKQNDQNNRSLEQSLQTMLATYGERLDATITKMDQHQQASTQTITKIIHDRPQIFNNPVCNTPDDVIAERNKIRAEGPK